MARDQVIAQNLTGGLKNVLNEVALTASDATNFEQVAWESGLHIVWYNSSADTAYDATIEAAADGLGRDVDIVHELNFGELAISKEIPSIGFQQSDGQVHFKAENAALLYAVVKMR